MGSWPWPCLPLGLWFSFLEGWGGFFSLALYSGAYIRKLTLQIHCGHVEHEPLASISWEHPAGQAGAFLRCLSLGVDLDFPRGFYVLLPLMLFFIWCPPFPSPP